jgi:predicted metal-dependent hydrolase
MWLKIKTKNKLEGKNNSLIKGLNWEQKKHKMKKKSNVWGPNKKNKTQQTRIEWRN